MQLLLYLHVIYNLTNLHKPTMTIDAIKSLIANDEHRQLELKKTIGELKNTIKT